MKEWPSPLTLCFAFVFCFAFALPALSQSCESTPSTQKVLEQLEVPDDARLPAARRQELRLELLREALSAAPADIHLHEAYQAGRLAGMEINRAAVIAEYEQLLASWYQLVNGGESPHFVLVGDRANWASFQPPTDKILDSMMEEAYGKEQGGAILSALRKAVRSTSTEALQYRPDLSYVATPK